MLDFLEIKIYFLNEFKMLEKCLLKVCDDVNYDFVMIRVRNFLFFFLYFMGYYYGMDVQGENDGSQEEQMRFECLQLVIIIVLDFIIKI